MSTPSRPAGSEPYIVAMANQADRSNRPTSFVVIGAIIVLASLIYALFGIRQYVEGNERIRRQTIERNVATGLLEQIEALENRNPDLDALYPSAGLMPNNLRRAIETAFADPERETDPAIFTVTEVSLKPTETTRGLLNTANVEVRATGRTALPIEDILHLVQTALREDPSSLMFLSELSIRTTPQGWVLEGLEFRRYSAARR
jgi:hypothetical protein